MYLVKSCFEEFNVFNQKKIKIGSLIEYRNAEEQIIDTFEGTYDLEVMLKNIHLPHRLFREIFGAQQSIASMHIKAMQINGLSAIFEGWDFYSEVRASVALTNKNRFIFCMSFLDAPELANDIFKDYNDKWFFNEQVTHMIAHEMAIQIKKEVIKKQAEGTSVFFEKFNEKKIEVRYQIQKIEYSQRRSLLTNEAIYKDFDLLPRIMQGIRFIKPASFSHEREVRFCFDVFEYGEILHPRETSIIINAEKILPLLKRA